MQRFIPYTVLCFAALLLLNCAARAGTVFEAKSRFITEGYIRLLTRDTYFWGWPMANMLNRRLSMEQLREPCLVQGILPMAPPNRLAMLTDYIDPAERAVACPNQDVVYGAAILALDREPAVVEIPDFGDRFWVCQAVDVRTDSFASLGRQYGTKPGFYLLVGPDWQGEIPEGILEVFRSSSNTGMVLPRVFQSDDEKDKRAVQAVVNGIDVYPLSEYDGRTTRRDWTTLPVLGDQDSRASEQGETAWVTPDSFFARLPAIIGDAKMLPGEESRYAQAAMLANLYRDCPELRPVMLDEAAKTETELIEPFLRTFAYGVEAGGNWITLHNGAVFGFDYYTRTAAARTNIFVNKLEETQYFFTERDSVGDTLDGAAGYIITFGPDLVPVQGFWSLTLYNEHRFFAPNELNRYSIGSKTKDLVFNSDGSLSIHVCPRKPAQGTSNWLPSPDGSPFNLYIRAYWPEQSVTDGVWAPPAVTKE